jgi:hypothetical protein
MVMMITMDIRIFLKMNRKHAADASRRDLFKIRDVKIRDSIFFIFKYLY